jgi:CRP-like cAMP-binding protein
VDRDQVLFRLFGKYCPEGTILATEGASGEELYVIQSGAVRLGAARPGEAPAVLGPGDLLGEEAFFGRTARAFRAEAVQDTRLIRVNDRTLDAVVRHGPQTARQIVERLLILVDRARADLAAWSAAHLLPRAAPHLVAAAGGTIAAADLAERSGISEQDARLVIEELARRGLLVRDGEAHRAADPLELKGFGEALLAGGGG